MKLPTLNQNLVLRVKGRTYSATCTDLFDGGCGYYFDAVFPKSTRYKFSPGEQCQLPELGEKCLADFVSYPTQETWRVRFLISK